MVRKVITPFGAVAVSPGRVSFGRETQPRGGRVRPGTGRQLRQDPAGSLTLAVQSTMPSGAACSMVGPADSTPS